ncbi:MAG: aldo/keto reductase [Clostridiales bacterium]|nr:aldo/keto reductase [Clostridiales bacterium]
MYCAKETRYDSMKYNPCGSSGLKLSALSLGLWQNFGIKNDYDTMKSIILTAFDNGVTHFDLANNYGPEPGRAEINFGRIFKENLKPYRDEIIISTKAGYEMWQGPYGGVSGTRKHLTASLNQSLKRMGLDYVDIFYHHCMDPETPLAETALAMADVIRNGKALYAGISNYNGKKMLEMNTLFEKYNVPFIINQNRYSIFSREIIDNSLREQAVSCGKGIIAFSPLAQGQLSDKYANGIPENSRLYGNERLQRHVGYDEKRAVQIKKLADFAHSRGETLSQTAVKWLLADSAVTSVLVGVRSKEQLLENLAGLSGSALTEEEMREIDKIVSA